MRRGERTGEYLNERDGSVLLWIPPGSFHMGSDSGDIGNMPVHEVRFAQGFFLGKYETSWGQYRAFCRATNRQEPPAPSLRHPSFQVDDRHPVVNVSWDDAVAYCRWAGLRLPSEAEWEYAARGTDGRTYPWGEQKPCSRRCNLADQSCPEGFHWRASYRDGHGYTAAVGSFPAGVSPFGALDLAGNVWEWVQDTRQDTWSAAPTDGSAWETGTAERIYRGGSWADSFRGCRSTCRASGYPDHGHRNVGFRPAR